MAAIRFKNLQDIILRKWTIKQWMQNQFDHWQWEGTHYSVFSTWMNTKLIPNASKYNAFNVFRTGRFYKANKCVYKRTCHVESHCVLNKLLCHRNQLPVFKPGASSVPGCATDSDDIPHQMQSYSIKSSGYKPTFRAYGSDGFKDISSFFTYRR